MVEYTFSKKKKEYTFSGVKTLKKNEPRSYTPLQRKLLENILHRNEGINQERGRYKTQAIGKGSPRVAEKECPRKTAEQQA